MYTPRKKRPPNMRGVKLIPKGAMAPKQKNQTGGTMAPTGFSRPAHVGKPLPVVKAYKQAQRAYMGRKRSQGS